MLYNQKLCSFCSEIGSLAIWGGNSTIGWVDLTEWQINYGSGYNQSYWTGSRYWNGSAWLRKFILTFICFYNAFIIIYG